MAPINLKQSTNSTTAAAAVASKAQDARLLIRETLRISADLASATPSDLASTAVHSLSLVANENRSVGLVENEFVCASLRLIYYEEIDGRKWKYVAEKNTSSGSFKKGSLRSISLQTPQAPFDNVCAVTSTSTRTPIYKAFAKGENIGDVTAEGECVGNVADLLGTGMSILISKRNPSLFTTFALFSCGYVLSSYQEIKSVVLHTLNRARFTVAVESFLKTGHVPSLQEGNKKEKIFDFPWLKEQPVVLGPRFKDAFQDPGAYLALEPFFEKERYIVTYNLSKGKVYALLKDQAKSDDILKAAFHAHVLLYFMRSSYGGQYLSQKQRECGYSKFVPTENDLQAHIAGSCNLVSSSYGLFKRKAAEQGWMMQESLLNPGHARLY